MTRPWHPGAHALQARGLPAWRPCLTRSRGEDGQPLTWEHVWFCDVGGSFYCFECRSTRPRVVVGPEEWIGKIRDALEAGNVRAARELVRVGPDGDVEVEDFAPNRAISQSAETAAAVEPRQVSDRAVVGGRNAAAGVTGGRDPISTDDAIAGHWTRRRSDVFDVEAIDPVLAQVWSGSDHSDWREFFTERAAIFEHLGGDPRPVAEMKARQLAGPEPRRSHAR